MSHPLAYYVLWFMFWLFLQPVKNQFWSTCSVQQTFLDRIFKTKSAQCRFASGCDTVYRDFVKKQWYKVYHRIWTYSSLPRQTFPGRAATGRHACRTCQVQGRVWFRGEFGCEGGWLMNGKGNKSLPKWPPFHKSIEHILIVWYIYEMKTF